MPRTCLEITTSAQHLHHNGEPHDRAQLESVRLAGAAVWCLGRHLHHLAPLDPDRRQGPLVEWGSNDLAVTRFSGRPAPPHPGGIPHLPDAVTREAYSQEVSIAGFWPGGSAIDQAAFYSYAYPVPEGFSEYPIEPTGAYFHPKLREFLLPYDAVRTAEDPDATLLAFLQSTYEAAAVTAGWDRNRLERDPLPPR